MSEWVVRFAIFVVVVSALDVVTERQFTLGTVVHSLVGGAVMVWFLVMWERWKQSEDEDAERVPGSVHDNDE